MKNTTTSLAEPAAEIPVASAWVKTSEGEFLVQLPDDRSRWGFVLCDGDQSWDGGFGAATSWEIVPESEVPKEIMEELGWLFKPISWEDS